jgi:hypothetical protein
VTTGAISREDLADSFQAALEFGRRYFVAGAPFTLIVSGVVGSEAIGIALIHNLITPLLVFPGSVAVHLIGKRLLPPKRSMNEPGRRWLAATLAVLLTWFGYMTIVGIPIRPPTLLLHVFGSKWAWIGHLACWVILASTIAQVCAGWLNPHPDDPGPAEADRPRGRH